MKKLILLMLAAGGATAAQPELRAEVAARAQPVLAVASQGPLHVATLLEPVFRWSTKNELRRIVRALHERSGTGEPLPHPKEFTRYLHDTHISGRSGVDAWGGRYYLAISRDSVVVGSPGPDLLPETADDLRLGWERASARRPGASP